MQSMKLASPESPDLLSGLGQGPGDESWPALLRTVYDTRILAKIGILCPQKSFASGNFFFFQTMGAFLNSQLQFFFFLNKHMRTKTKHSSSDRWHECTHVVIVLCVFFASVACPFFFFFFLLILNWAPASLALSPLSVRVPRDLWLCQNMKLVPDLLTWHWTCGYAG